MRFSSVNACMLVMLIAVLRDINAQRAWKRPRWNRSNRRVRVRKFDRPVRPSRPLRPPPRGRPNDFLDPTNLADMLGQCGSDPTLRMDTVFGGMFLSRSDVNVLAQEVAEELKPRLHTKKNRKNYVQNNRYSKTIGTISALSTAESNAASNCCNTKFDITAPGTVMVNGTRMSVVHMNHSYQFVQEGSCTSAGARCRDIGICTQIYKYAFLLMYDPELVGKVNPPVRYGRTQVRSHCECMNIGGL